MALHDVRISVPNTGFGFFRQQITLTRPTRSIGRDGGGLMGGGQDARAGGMTSDDDQTERILTRLRALASPPRLALLKALVTPSRSTELRVRAASERVGFEPVRNLSRSGVIEHLEVLVDAGLVRRMGETYVTDQQAVVALLQDLGDLARLRALVEVDVEVTRAAPPPHLQPVPVFPRVLVANGPEAGRAFQLEGEGPWRVGRGAESEISLAFDPHVSRAHVVLERDAEGYLARVAPTAKNPVFVDFAKVSAGEAMRARPGALLSLGATLLVLQTE